MHWFRFPLPEDALFPVVPDEYTLRFGGRIDNVAAIIEVLQG